MKKIGLIGGMSFESTAIYYRMINEMVREACGGLTSADILLHSVNFAEIVALQKAGDWAEAADRLGRSAAILEKAGADCILICTNTMHKVAGEVERHIDIPLINIIDTTANALNAHQAKKPLLLATRYTMEDGFYADRMLKSGPLLITPDHLGRVIIHDVIFNELCAGHISDASRNRVLEIIKAAKAEGADSVILGCTEICMLIDPSMVDLPVFDSTAIHAAAAVAFALGGQQVAASAVAA
jgi:aspartate racemase